MNRRDYRAHCEWADGIRAAARTPLCPVHHTRRPRACQPRRTWRAMLAAMLGGGL